MNRLESFMFYQSNYKQIQITFIRMILVVISIMMIFGPYHELVGEYAKIIFENEITPWSLFDSIIINSFLYNIVRYSVFVLCIINLVWDNKYLLLLLLIVFTVFQYINYSLTPYAWNFNNHLIFFLLVLSFSKFFVETRYQQITGSFSVSFPLLYIGILYFQAGLSKLIHGGVDWVLTGRTLRQFSFFLGQNQLKFLMNKIYVSEFFSLLTIIVELSVIFFIIRPNKHKYLAILLITFHLSIYLVMDISFWHLVVFYPVLLLNSRYKDQTMALST